MNSETLLVKLWDIMGLWLQGARGARTAACSRATGCQCQVQMICGGLVFGLGMIVFVFGFSWQYFWVRRNCVEFTSTLTETSLG